jgi:dephospho-CoA kinase
VILGLTGSIGMGKSTVAAMFRQLGVPVFDADAVVHAAQGPGGRALADIERLFPGVTGPAGLDRGALGARVFADPHALKRLEAVLHPLVDLARRAFLARHRRRPLVVLDVPLLFESGGWRACDLVAVVSAPLRVQRARVLARPGMTRAKFEAVLARQMPDARKRLLADIVIPTGRGRRATWLAVRRIVGERGR